MKKEAPPLEEKSGTSKVSTTVLVLFASQLGHKGELEFKCSLTPKPGVSGLNKQISP